MKLSQCFCSSFFFFLKVCTSVTRNNQNNLILLVKTWPESQQKQGSNDQTDTFLRKTSKPVSHHAAHPMIWGNQSHVRAIITWFPGYTGGIRVQVGWGLTVWQCCSFCGQSGQHCTIMLFFSKSFNFWLHFLFNTSNVLPQPSQKTLPTLSLTWETMWCHKVLLLLWDYVTYL